MSLTLVIANKAYSSWSLRPWLALRQFNIPFSEKLIRLYEPGSRATILAEGGPGTVPILHDGDVTVWESLAIIDYVNDIHAGGGMWPGDRAARGFARAIAAEMHSGFSALRSHCPMNVRRRIEAYALTPGAQADVDRIVAVWSEARGRFGVAGKFLFGSFGAADAMYAPVVMRLHFYAIPVPPVVRRYIDAVLQLPATAEWIAAAHREPWLIESSERY